MDASGESTVAQKDNGTVTQDKGLLQQASETISHLAEAIIGRGNDDGERLDNDDDRRREKFQPNEQTDRRNQLVDASDPNKAVVRSVTGTVKWFSIYDHYGFINRVDTGEDVFVHVSALIQKGRLRYALEVDQEVEFDVAFGIKGPKAVAVSLPGGLPIEGGRYLRFNRRPGGGGGGGSAAAEGGANRRRTRSISQPNGGGQQSGGETTDNDQPQQRNRPQQQQRRQGRPRRERKRMGSRRANRQRRRSTAQSQAGDDGSSSEKQQQSAAEKQQQAPVKEIIKEVVVVKQGTQEKKQGGNAPHQKQAGDAPQQKRDGDAPRQTQSDADTSASDPKQPMEA